MPPPAAACRRLPPPAAACRPVFTPFAGSFDAHSTDLKDGIPGSEDTVAAHMEKFARSFLMPLARWHQVCLLLICRVEIAPNRPFLAEPLGCSAEELRPQV
jgi:hypothetical protein